MSEKDVFFEPCTNYMLGGYYIPVRNSWNYQIEKKHITDEEQEAYALAFGEKILLEEDFMDWWTQFKHSQEAGS